MSSQGCGLASLAKCDEGLLAARRQIDAVIVQASRDPASAGTKTATERGVVRATGSTQYEQLLAGSYQKRCRFGRWWRRARNGRDGGQCLLTRS